jgi:glycerate kinase
MADASGIILLKPQELNPLRTISYGTGEQILAALDMGVNKIIIGMGGSATVDGGTGILKALGLRFLDSNGSEISELPSGLINLATVDISRIDKRILSTEIIVMCDVDNLLLGEKGAAAMFGPQKGASAQAVILLDKVLTILSEVGKKTNGKEMASIKYGGTAGGAAAGLYSFLNAKLINGIDYFLQLTGFDQILDHADLVITGEGRIDEQTLQGKGPYGVAYQAKLKGLPVIALAGQVPIEYNEALRKYFDVLLSIGQQPAELAIALTNTAENLTRTSCEIGNILAVSVKI